MTSLGLSSSSGVITFDQNWHHGYSTSARGKYLSIDAQFRVIGAREPEIYTKMLKKLSEKTQTKICCHYTWLLHGKNCPSQWRFLSCDTNRFFYFFYWHEALRAEKRKPLVKTVGSLTFMPSAFDRCFWLENIFNCFTSHMTGWTKYHLKMILKESLSDPGRLRNPANIKGANKNTKVYVGRSTTMHNLLFCASTLIT